MNCFSEILIDRYPFIGSMYVYLDITNLPPTIYKLHGNTRLKFIKKWLVFSQDGFVKSKIGFVKYKLPRIRYLIC